MSGQDTAEEKADIVDELGVGGFDHAADLKGELWAVFGGSAGLPYFFINDNGGGCRQIGDMQPEELTEGL